MIEPYPIKFNGESFLVVRNPAARDEILKARPDINPADIGYLAIALFRQKDYTDYAAVARVDDVAETESWTPCYEQYELVDWMAGFTIEEGTQRWQTLHNLHRKVGKFATHYGWNPDVVIEDEPSEGEFQNYIEYVAARDDKGGELYVPENFSHE